MKISVFFIFFQILFLTSLAQENASNCEIARKKYLEQYPDVANAGFDPWIHYNRHGKMEGRIWPSCDDKPNSGYDPLNCESARKKYLEQNPDVANAGFDPWVHYNRHGKMEGRIWPNCFDDNKVISSEARTNQTSITATTKTTENNIKQPNITATTKTTDINIKQSNSNNSRTTENKINQTNSNVTKTYKDLEKLFTNCKWCNKRIEYFSNPNPGYKFDNFGTVVSTVSIKDFLSTAVSMYGWGEKEVKENALGIIATCQPQFCSENCAYKYKKIRE